MADFKVGELVALRPDVARNAAERVKVWKVAKVPTRSNEINYTIYPTDGNGRGMKIRGELLIPASDLPTSDDSNVTVIPVPTSHDPGTVVRFKGDVYVVTRSIGDGKHQLFPLGGSDRYYRGVPAASLTVIPRDKIAISD